ncbi:uncharacterized protein LOC114296855 [Camellia sinensis]|uniref:uncharacterized protein LOC114296855 n=1 Tax=Camellia sinensis TaxID=4442 RepID=UPI00103620CD|nr:uncharacterized protein LOC114296855 [Camellia sinensis]
MAEKGTLDFGIGKEDDREELRDFVRKKSEYDDSRDGKRKKFEKDGIGSSRKREKKLKSKSKGRDGSKLKLKKAGDSGERSRDQNGEAEVKEIWDTIAREPQAAHWKNTSFPHCDMLCIIFEKDRAMGKDAVTADDVLEEVSRNESIDTQNLSVEEIDTLSNASINNEGNSNQGKKRKNSSDSSDAFREAAMIIGTKIEEATDKFSRALGVDLDIALKRDKINEELSKLSNL